MLAPVRIYRFHLFLHALALGELCLYALPRISIHAADAAVTHSPNLVKDALNIPPFPHESIVTGELLLFLTDRKIRPSGDHDRRARCPVAV